MKKNAPAQKKSEPQPATSWRDFLATPAVGETLSTIFGLLFLFQCVILPLVGKAAMQGSGSPGAGAAATVWKNQLFFGVMLLLTLAVGGVAFAAKRLRQQRDGSPFPMFTAGLLGLAGLLLVAFATGLLGI